MNLFEKQQNPSYQASMPLASRMRPKKINQFIGQNHILGPDSLLRRVIENDKMFSSIILWGPPGTGKTTLATIIANSTKSHFEIISAVTSGVSDIRSLIDRAKQYGRMGKKTIALVDEIHRFNKSQQDALLPHVEDGTIILIGATTENPYFEVIPALVSRSRVFNFKSLTTEQLTETLKRAINDKDNGYGNFNIEISDEALNHFASIAGGDTRSALNALELAIESYANNENNKIIIDLKTAEDASQKKAIRYDKKGDQHYDIISAFIKSVRGSDPSAALYWLAKMIHAGEDPKFIMRRLLILASEDIGMADPLGIVVASSCARALEWCGLPEAQYHLAHATTYLATANKSNSMCDYFNALEIVKNENDGSVPNHLKDAARDGKTLGHGQGYKYPHNYPNHFIKQQYLPTEHQNKQFYNPRNQGYEKKVAERLKIWNENQSDKN